MRKTLLVTGAAAGIGAATARMAASRGYDLETVAMDCEAAGAQVIPYLLSDQASFVTGTTLDVTGGR